eukprot:3780169-Pleurochrysis_carterae.AAC.1
MSWQYDGVEKTGDEMSDLQLGVVGSTLKHDVFGFCTMLEGPQDGNLKVKVHSDNSERSLTCGHFQVVEQTAEMPVDE